MLITKNEKVEYGDISIAQEKLFISIARTGIACGLWHPFEWLTHYNRTLGNWCVYKEIDARESEANEMFLAFFHGCASGEGDPMQSWGIDDMNAAINRYYEKPKS